MKIWKKKFDGISITLIVVCIVIIGIFLYKFGKDALQNASQFFVQKNGVPFMTQEPLFSGKLTRVSEDLFLFKRTEFDQQDGFAPASVYYSAGVFVKGPYKGFERIIALRESLGPGGPLVYIFSTKDRKTYILHEEDDASVIYPETDYRNPFQTVDKTKIIKIVKLPSDHPQTISLSKDFSLYKNGIVTQNVKSGKTSKEGYEIYENIVRSDFSSYETLPLSVPDLTFYGVVNDPVLIPDEWEEDAKVQAQLRAKFIKGTTGVIAVDSSGVPYSYTLTRPSEITQYEKQMQTYRAASVAYEKERVRFENKEIKVLPDYPQLPSLPNVRFFGKQIKGPGDIFDTYDIAVPYICGVEVDMPVIQNISDDELLSFGTVGGIELFILKDAQHPFNKLAYRNKMLMIPEEFDVINKGKEKLSYDAYVAKHPLFFMKDFWGRWMAVGEYDYKMIGGCGKPVLYLYPEHPTDVSISFSKPMEITYSIPTYKTDWYVKAYPDGTLQDLQRTRTDCTSFDENKHGSEYAKGACERNQYPYLYWAGNRIGMEYPFNPHIGWVVLASDLGNFLASTLDSIGFTFREKEDFLTYWVPAMLEKQAPWYHVRFLQTSDMNQFIPMDIRPIPDRYYRIFLDWKALSSKPTYAVAPQQLDTIIRKGFTVVEWGGLRQ